MLGRGRVGVNKPFAGGGIGVLLPRFDRLPFEPRLLAFMAFLARVLVFVPWIPFPMKVAVRLLLLEFLGSVPVPPTFERLVALVLRERVERERAELLFGRVLVVLKLEAFPPLRPLAELARALLARVVVLLLLLIPPIFPLLIFGLTAARDLLMIGLLGPMMGKVGGGIVAGGKVSGLNIEDVDVELELVLETGGILALLLLKMLLVAGSVLAVAKTVAGRGVGVTFVGVDGLLVGEGQSFFFFFSTLLSLSSLFRFNPSAPWISTASSYSHGKQT